MSQTLADRIEAVAAGEPDGILLVRSGLTDVRGLAQLLRERRLAYRELVLDMGDSEQRRQFDGLCRETHWPTLPQIFMDGEFVGGDVELRQRLDESGPESVNQGTGATVDPRSRSMWLLSGLGYLSALPFVLASLAMLGMAGPAAEMLEKLLIGYGAVILSFLGAVHWGRILDAGPQRQISPLSGLLAVIPALFGWGTLLLPAAVSLPGQAILFVAIYAVDRVALAELPLGRWYVHLRNRLTAVVVLALLLAWFAVLR